MIIDEEDPRQKLLIATIESLDDAPVVTMEDSRDGESGCLSEDDTGLVLRYGSVWMTTRQYGRLVDEWVTLMGLDPAGYGTHSLRRTTVALIYRRTGNLCAC